MGVIIHAMIEPWSFGSFGLSQSPTIPTLPVGESADEWITRAYLNVTGLDGSGESTAPEEEALTWAKHAEDGHGRTFNWASPYPDLGPDILCVVSSKVYEGK